VEVREIMTAASAVVAAASEAAVVKAATVRALLNVLNAMPNPFVCSDS
jgi:hypothetical protein